MCCVIPPASVATTALLRIASRSVVLPWSTWPMIVTTGGRGSSVLLVVLVGLRVDLLVGGVADDDLAARLGGEQLDGLVGERLRDGHHLAEVHHELDDLRDRQPDRSGEILDVDARGDRDRTGRRRDGRTIALRRGGRRARRAGPARRGDPG